MTWRDAMNGVREGWLIRVTGDPFTFVFTQTGAVLRFPLNGRSIAVL